MYNGNLYKKTDDFIEEFTEDLMKLKIPSFIANMQKEFYNEKKANLKEADVAINCDIAESYSFILQDEIQFRHWNNSEATIHPFISITTDKMVQSNI